MSSHTTIFTSTVKLLGKSVNFVDTKDGSKYTHSKKWDIQYELPRDIIDLAGSFFAGFEDINTIRNQLPNLLHDDTNSLSGAIRELLQHSENVKCSARMLYSKSEHSLYQAHLCFAATTDVGRMIFESFLLQSPSTLQSFPAYHAAKPPPAALHRRLGTIHNKVERMKLLIADVVEFSASEQNSNSIKQNAVRVSLSSSLTVADINALLTDIDNQFELVQRMIVFLKSEISTLEATVPADRHKQTIAQFESVESALDGLSLAEGRSSQQEGNTEGWSAEASTVGAQSRSYSLVRQSGINYARDNQGDCEEECARDSTDSLDQHKKLHGTTARRPVTARKSHQHVQNKRTEIVWAAVCSAVKQTKRPNYSFEIYEQMMDSRDTEVSVVAAPLPASQQQQRATLRGRDTARSAMFRHYSSAYRALKGSHHVPFHSHQQQEEESALSMVDQAASVAVSQFQRATEPVSDQMASVSAHKSSFAHTPETKSRPHSSRSPFVMSPTWKLADDSPGDWRHIQSYADRSKIPGMDAMQSDSKPTAVSAAFPDKGYVSPLTGILEHISKYPERIPKAPAAAATAKAKPSSISIGASAAGAAASEDSTTAAYAPGLVRRERSNKLVDSPDSTPRERTSSKDAEKSLLSPQMAAFANSTSGSSSRQATSSARTGGSLGGDFYGEDKTADSANKDKKATKTSIAPTLLSPSVSSAAFTAATAAQQQVPVIPTTVADIAQRMREIYAAAVPEKLSDVPKLLLKYAGKETELMEKVIKKYGNIPPPPSNSNNNKSLSGTPQSPPGRKSSLSANDTGGGGGGGGSGAALERKGSIGGFAAGSGGDDSNPINIRKSSLGTPNDAGAASGNGDLGDMGALFDLGGAKTPSSATAGSLSGSVTPSSLFPPSGKTGSATVTGFGTPTPAATATPTPFGGAGPSSSLFGKPTGATATPAAATTPSSAATAGGWGAGGGSLFGKPTSSAAAAVAATPPSNTTSTEPVPGSVEDVLRKVQAIYTAHNPSKLSEIPTLMEKYRGKELQLIANLEKKYGPTPASAATSSQPASVFGGAGGGAGGGAQASGFGSTGFGSASGGANAGTASTLFGKPSTGFGQTTPAAATAPAVGVSGFASPFSGASAGSTVSGFASPFAAAAGAGSGIPSPFGAPAAAGGGNVPSPFGGSTAQSSASNTTTPGGIGSLFGGGRAASASPGTSFGQPTAGGAVSGGIAAAGGAGGGLFGNRGSAVPGTASPFGNTAGGGSIGGSGTGGLFGNNSTATAAGTAGTSPFSSGYSTPLGKSAQIGGGGGGSIFQQQQQPNSNVSAMGTTTGFGQTGNAMLGGTTSPSVFGNRSAAPSNSLFGGGGSSATSTAGNVGQSGSLFGGGGGGAQAAAQQQGASGTLNSLQDVYQRVQAIYTQHNPSKLSEIPTLMEKYRGKELQLIANLEKKYNINSAQQQMSTSTPSTGFGAFGGGGGPAGLGGNAGASSVFGGQAGGGTATGFGGNNTAGTVGGNSLFGRPSPSSGLNPAAAAAAAATVGGGTSPFGGNQSAGFGAGASSGGGAGTGGLFGGTGAFGGGAMGATSTGFGAGAGAGPARSSVFGSTTVLGGGGTSTGFGNSFGGGGGGGSLFGGGAAGNSNSMWGNR